MTLGRVGYDYFRNLLQLCCATLQCDELAYNCEFFLEIQ